MPHAKYDYKVMGKVAKNSRKKAQSEIVELIKADEDNNLQTVMNKLNIIHHELKQEIGTIKQEVELLKEEVRRLSK